MSNFPDITYSDICQRIADVLCNTLPSTGLLNIGDRYNTNIPVYMKPTYGTDTDGSTIDVSNAGKNASIFWQVYCNDNILYRLPSDKSNSTSASIKKEIVDFLERYFGINMNNKVTPGSYLETVQVLMWFLAWKNVIHTSQQSFPQYATGTNNTNESVALSCYDDTVSDLEFIKKCTGWDNASRINKITESSAKLVQNIDFQRIINALVEAFKVTYKFSGTYYDFLLLGGMPGSKIVLNIELYDTDKNLISGNDEVQFNNNLIKHTSIEYIGGNPAHNIALTAPSTTQNYYFSKWVYGNKTECNNNYVNIPVSVLFKSDTPIYNNWYCNAYYQEKSNNNLQVILKSNGKFTYNSSDNTVTANIIGEKDSISYDGCSINGGNGNTVVYTESGDDGFSVSSGGIVTCKNKGTCVVLINQATTDKVKSYLSSYTVIVVEEKLKLTTNMFTFVAPSSPTYGDASKNIATFNLKSGYNGVSDIRTVQYAKYQSTLSWTDNVPVTDGTYVCRLIVNEGSVYNASTLYDYDNWKFVVPAEST